MADDDKLSIYQELINRGAVPEQHKPVVDELIRRNVLRGRKGRSPAAVAEVDKLEKAGDRAGFTHGLADNVTLGAFNPVMGAIGATAKTGYKALTGQPTDWQKDYEHERDFLDERLARLRKNQGVWETAAEMALSLPLMPLGPLKAGAEAVRLGKQLIDASKLGAGFSGVYGFNSARGGVGEHVQDTLTHGVAGAALGPLLHLGVNAAARLPNATSNALMRMTGRSDSEVAAVNANRAELSDAGVREFGPAVSENRLMNFAARGLANRPFVGRSLREGAQRSIQDLEGKVQNALARETGGLPANDIGAEVQGTLRKAIVDETTPGHVVQAMPDDQLPKLMGGTPRPIAEPRTPREVPDQLPAPVDPRTLEYKKVEPQPVEREPARMTYSKESDIPYNEAHVAAHEEAMNAYNLANLEVVRIKGEIDKLAAAKKQKPKEYIDWAIWHGRDGIKDPVVAQYVAAVEARNAASEKANQAYDLAVKGRQDAWKRYTETDFAEAQKMADREYQAKVDKARAQAEAETAANRDAAIQAAQAEAKRAADEETARLRAAANDEAEAATKREQQDLDKRWLGDGGGGRFEPGATRESYKTEFAAAYEAANRNTPKFQRHLFGSRKERESGVPNTATRNLLDSFALEARSKYELPGYKNGKPFGERDNELISPEFHGYLSKLLGKDIADKLKRMSAARRMSHFAPDPQGIRELATEVRRARDAARKLGTPGVPGEPNQARVSALNRLHEAIKDDYHRFLTETGPAGAELSGMIRQIDARYREHIEGMAQPLKKLFGENTKPLDAMDQLAKAAEKGDLATLRPYMRVMTEKADPTRGAAAIVSHMTQSAESLPAFLKGYRAMKPEVKDTLFASEGGRALRTELDRFAKIGERLEPYAASIERNADTSGLRAGHIPLGALFYFHFAPTLASYAGAAALGKFMSSPAYVRWLTRAAEIKTPGEWTKHLGHLGMIAERDTEYGADIRRGVGKVLDQMNPMPRSANAANAADDRADRPSGIMKLGGPVEIGGESAEPSAAARPDIDAPTPQNLVESLSRSRKMTPEQRTRAEDMLFTDEWLERLDEAKQLKGPARKEYMDLLLRQFNRELDTLGPRSDAGGNALMAWSAPYLNRARKGAAPDAARPLRGGPKLLTNALMDYHSA